MSLEREAADQVHLGPGLLHGLGHRQGDGTAQASAQHRHPAVALHVGGGAQRAHKVVEAVPLLQLVQGQGGAPDLLIDHSDLSVLGAGDGQGDTLPRLVHPQDDELARLGFGGDQRCLH